MESKDWVELLKFPLTILVAIGSVVLGSVILNVKPTNLEVGELKVKLETEIKKELVNSSIDYEEEIRKEVARQLQNIQPSSLESVDFSDSSISLKHSQLTEDVVSDKIAQMAIVSTDSGIESIFKSTVGYIWIGNYSGAVYTHNQINANSIEEVQVGQSYFVNGNLVIRESSPVENIKYYKGVKKIGVARKGTKVKVLESPELDKRYQQYWVKIEVII